MQGNMEPSQEQEPINPYQEAQNQINTAYKKTYPPRTGEEEKEYIVRVLNEQLKYAEYNDQFDMRDITKRVIAEVIGDRCGSIEEVLLIYEYLLTLVEFTTPDETGLGSETIFEYLEGQVRVEDRDFLTSKYLDRFNKQIKSERTTKIVNTIMWIATAIVLLLGARECDSSDSKKGNKAKQTPEKSASALVVPFLVAEATGTEAKNLVAGEGFEPSTSRL